VGRGAAAAWLLVGVPLLLPAATLQVGPGRPYANLQAVAGLLNPGDVVEVDGNTTYSGDVVFSRPGTPAQKITIRGVRVAGKRPVLSGTVNTVTFSTESATQAADHYVFEGFEVTGGTGLFRGIFHQADDLTIRDCVVHDCARHGILGADQGSGSCLMEYVEVYRCGSGTGNHQVYMATDEVAHPGSVFRMQYCYLHDGLGGNNVKSRAERNEIYSNWIEGALYHELELIGPDPDGAPEGWSEGLVREDSDVVGNVLWQRNTFSVTRVGGDGTGQTNGRYRFVNNTIVAGTSAVFRIFDGIQSIEMHNNVLCRADGSAVNVVRTAEAVWTDGEQIAGTSNWVASGSTAIPAEWTGTLTGASPGFTDLANSDPRPAAGSPLVDAAGDAPPGPPGFPFPSPLFPPTFHPPLHAAPVSGSPAPRPYDCDLDLGAFERPAAVPRVGGLAFLGDKRTLTWRTVPGATGYDTLKGDLALLRSSGGLFSASLLACLDGAGADTQSDDPATPSAGNGFYYLVRSRPGGSYDCGCPSQASPRDVDIGASPARCP